MSEERKSDQGSEYNEIEEEGQEEYSARPCFICGEVPESIINLRCGHNIDIPCAAALIFQRAKDGDLDLSELECEGCGESTVLTDEVKAAIVGFIQACEEAEEEEIENNIEEQDDNEEQMELPKSIKGRPHTPLTGERSHTHTHNKGSENKGDHKRAPSESRDGASNMTEVSLHFACVSHPSEEYTYYSVNHKKLYCPQCILEYKGPDRSRDLKPIKRCMGIISQHFQDLMSNVEVSRDLLLNRQKDCEIKLSDLQGKLESIKYTSLLKFDEAIEAVQNQKRIFSDKFEERCTSYLGDLDKVTTNFSEKLEYLDTIIDQITQLQEGDSPEEDMYGFFFANQEKIQSFLKEDTEHVMMNKIRSICDVTESKAKTFCEQELVKDVSILQNVIPDIFQSIIGKQSTLMSNIQKLEKELSNSNMVKVPQMSNTEFFLRNKKSMKSEESQFEGDRDEPRVSGSESKVTRSRGRDARWTPQIKTSNNYAGNTVVGNPNRSNVYQFYELKKTVTQPNGVTANKSNARSDFNRFYNDIFKTTTSNTSANVHSNIRNTPLRKEPEQPLAELEKKLAFYDLRGKVKATTGYSRGIEDQIHKPTTHFLASNSSSAMRNYPASGTNYNTSKLTAQPANIDSLRDFRQRIRDRLNKEFPMNRRNISLY